MNEETLYSLRHEPSSEFASTLRGRLGAADASARRAGAARHRMLLKPLAAMAMIAALFAIPAVRTSAQSLLLMFRVRTFIGVPLTNERARDLTRRFDLEGMLGGNVNVIDAPGQPIEVASPDAASGEAGYAVRVPAALPDGASLVRTAVTRASHAQVTVDASLLSQVMEALSIDDLTVPAALAGQVVDIRVSPVVFTTYRLDQAGTRVELVQELIPNVQLPSNVDMAALGEIGLRILGLPPADAREIAAAIDWKTTLLVPIPPDASSFRQVDVNGASGLLVEKFGSTVESLLLWATSDRAYAMKGRIGGAQLVALAASVR